MGDLGFRGLGLLTLDTLRICIGMWASPTKGASGDPRDIQDMF